MPLRVPLRTAGITQTAPPVAGCGLAAHPASIHNLILLHLPDNGIGHIAKNTSYEPHNRNLLPFCAEELHSLIEAETLRSTHFDSLWLPVEFREGVRLRLGFLPTRIQSIRIRHCHRLGNCKERVGTPHFAIWNEFA
jgi:hypothetical protein